MNGSASLQTALLRYPTLISTFGTGTIDIYFSGNDGGVYSKQFINGAWYPSTTTQWRLGGMATSDIAAISRSSGQTDLFIRGLDFDIYTQMRNSSDPYSWSAPCECCIGLNGTARPREAISSSLDQIDVFQYGWDGILYIIPFRPSPDTSVEDLAPEKWSCLGANDNLYHDWFNFTPTVISQDVGRYDFFGVRADNALYHRSFNEIHGWDAEFARIGGHCTSRPAVVSIRPGKMDVFVRGGDARVWHVAYDDGTTQGWTDLTPIGNISILGEPHAITYGSRIALFVASQTDRAIWYTFSSGESWTEWISLGGDFANPPKAISKADAQIDVFVIGRGAVLMWRSWKEGRGSWEPGDRWENLGSAP